MFNYHRDFNIVIFFFQAIKKQLAKYHFECFLRQVCYTTTAHDCGGFVSSQYDELVLFKGQYMQTQYCLGQNVTPLIENWEVYAETIPDSFNIPSCGSLRQKTQLHLVALYPGT